VTVRFHGYNNEEEVRISDLMESFGPEAVEEQVEQARLDEDYEEDEEEEEGAGDDFRVGDWCRAEWNEDAVVYEAVIESINRKKGTAKARSTLILHFLSEFCQRCASLASITWRRRSLMTCS